MPVVAHLPEPPPALYQGREVFILGAGFSKAVCPQCMPVLDDLGDRVAEKFCRTASFALLPSAAQDALAQHRLPTGSLEVWLSHLATRAPFLDEPERLHNAAIAQELTKLIVDEIERCEMSTLSTPMPPWLARLVTLWDRTSATVITFNYDTLIEHAVQDAHFPWILFPTDPVIESTSLHLLKMHGSINWWWIPADRVGNTVTKAGLAGRWGEPEPSARLAGMVNFVVPPLAGKSDYYDLSAVREIWQSARESLTHASRLVFMGYSAPLTDLTVAALLSHYAARDVPCIVADIAAEAVVDRLRRLGLGDARGYEADEPLRQFVGEYEQLVSRKVARSLMPLLEQFEPYSGDPVIARIGDDSSEPRRLVVRVATEGDVTSLCVHNWKPGEDVAELAIQGRELLDAIRQTADSDRRLVLRLPDQPDRALLNVAHRIYHRNFLAVEA